LVRQADLEPIDIIISGYQITIFND